MLRFANRLEFNRRKDGQVEVRLLPPARGRATLSADEWAHAIAAMSPWGVNDVTLAAARDLTEQTAEAA